MERSSAIVVQLPEAVDKKQARKLRRELKDMFRSGNPSVIVDLSRVKKMDSEGIEGLLCFLE
ncbi:MAG: STAS domain-containing protein, partial [Acidobacteria bacterium]|nr:STAS domain-containing protein [Acidobacteriota bacterium]